MRPPICAICHKDFRRSTSEGGGVRFKLTEKDKAHNQRLKENLMVGHPAGYEWFCEDHIEAAKKYKHLTWGEARTKIKEESKGGRFWNFFKKE